MTGLLTWMQGFNWMALWPEMMFLLAIMMMIAVDAWRPTWSRWTSYLGITLLLALLFILFQFYFNRTHQAFHRSVFLDNFGLTTMVFYLVAGLLVAIAVWPRYEETPAASQVGVWLAVLFMAVFSLGVMTTTLNLIVLFIALELLSLTLYVLIAMPGGSDSGLEAATKYFLLGAFASAFFLYGVALVYGALGTIDMSKVREILAEADSVPLSVHMAFALILVGVGFKASVVPFHLWTPEVYQGAPTELTGFMAVAVKTAAFGVLYRLIRLMPVANATAWTALIAVLAAFTMVAGNLNALRQTALKRLLAYSSIAHAGYILVGFLGTPEASRNSVLFYLLVYTFMNLGAFLVVAALEARGTAADLAHHEGLVYRSPGWALALSVFLLALAGVPPTGGFLAKLWVFWTALETKWTAMVLFAVVNSLIGAYYYLRWMMVLFRPAERKEKRRPKRDEAGMEASIGYVLAVALCLFFTLQLGLLPDRLMRLVRLAIPGI